MRAVSIGNLSFIVFDDRQPASWSPDADVLRKVEMLGANLHRLVWWSDRVSYVIERNGLALELPFPIALEISQSIIGDESADHNRRG